MLDVIFCNTENYPSAWESRFEDWADWVRRVQIETDFFYAMPGLTVEDVRYLRSSESLRRSLPARADEGPAAVQQATRSAEAIAGAVISDDFNPLRVKEFGRQGLRALALVYRLASVYLPAGPDGGFLRRAARDLLYEFVAQCESGSRLLDEVLKEGRGRFDEQIDWLLEPVGVRKTPDLPTARPPYDKGEVQGGIFSPYEDIDHGCLLLMRFHDRQAAAGFLDAIRGWVTLDSGKQKEKANLPFVNIAFTCEGLRAIGLSQTQIDLFPQEFREGIEARASLLGDRGPHHPRRWRLPRRNWNALPGAQQPAVELAAVHVMVQMRTDRGTPSTGDTLDPGDPLFAHVTALLGASPGTELLSVQPMVRYVETVGGEKVAREHFGFVDASAQPVIDPVEKGKIYPNQVHLGEFLLDHDNEAEVPQDPEEACDPEAAAERRAWRRNGSFLVVRKLSQDVEALTTAARIRAVSRSMPTEQGTWRPTGLCGCEIAANRIPPPRRRLHPFEEAGLAPAARGRGSGSGSQIRRRRLRSACDAALPSGAEARKPGARARVCFVLRSSRGYCRSACVSSRSRHRAALRSPPGDRPCTRRRGRGLPRA